MIGDESVPEFADGAGADEGADREEGEDVFGEIGAEGCPVGLEEEGLLTRAHGRSESEAWRRSAVVNGRRNKCGYGVCWERLDFFSI